MVGARVICLLLLALTFVSLSCAWNTASHSMIAQIASHRISPKAQSAIEQMIGEGESLAKLAPWADDYRMTHNGAWSGSCHYVNLPRQVTSFDPQRDCSPECCVVAAIQNYTSILNRYTADRSWPSCNYTRDDEPCPLAFLIHFVGDVHQPLHVSYKDDEGGNLRRVRWFEKNANLHAVWDALLLDKWQSDYAQDVKFFLQWIESNPDEVRRMRETSDPVLWADESFGCVLDTVYNFEPWKAPSVSEVTSGGVAEAVDDAQLSTEPELSADYFDRNLPVVQRRLVAAAVRLAARLDDIFGSGGDTATAD